MQRIVQSKIQKFLHDYNSSSSSEEQWKIHLCIGIHLGDVVRKDNDILGDAVKIASRIQLLAEPDGDMRFTAGLRSDSQQESPLRRLEKAKLKNVRFPTGVFSLLMPWDSSVEQPLERRHLAILTFSNISPDPNDEVLLLTE